MNRDLIREYVSYLRVEKGLAKNSLEAYESDLGKLKLWTEKNGFVIEALTRQDLREWLIDLGREKLSDNSKRRIVSALRGFYKFLLIDGHIKVNPTENLDLPQKGLYLPRFLNQAELDQLLAIPEVSTEIGVRDRAIIELMYASGLRVTEVIGLKIADIDLDAGVLTTIGKGSKTRRVPVGSSAVEWVKRYTEVRRKRDEIDIPTLFVTPGGKPLN